MNGVTPWARRVAVFNAMWRAFSAWYHTVANPSADHEARALARAALLDAMAAWEDAA